MNVSLAARRMIPNIYLHPNDDPATGREHIHMMLDKIITGKVRGDKAHRWLGWVQACVYMSDAMTLEELKDLNHSC